MERGFRHGRDGNANGVGIVGGRGDGRHHYDRGPRLSGTVMRHFVLLPFPPPPLAHGVATRTAVTQLVPGTGPAQRLPPADAGALTLAVLVAAVAVPADAHLPCATAATV